MSTVIFLALSAIFIGALYYFMFMAKGGKKAADGGAEGANDTDEPQVVGAGGRGGRRGAADRLRNRRAQAAANEDSDEIDEEEEKERLHQWARDNDEDKDGVIKGFDAAGRKLNKKDLAKQEKLQQRR